ncbi:hypothetical protein ABPG72_021391 [Tetrahymena utriculariae]
MISASEEKELTFEWEVRENDIPYSKHMIAGCIAGMIEHSTMFPFDNIKTHSQVSKNMNFFQIVRQLHSEGGILAFYRGIGLVACGSMPAHAAFFSVYELARVKLGVNDEEHHPYLFALTGACAQFLHDLIMTPIDVIKQRKQISNFPVSDIIRNMIKTEGYTSLIRSFPVTYLMNLPLSAILVGANETLKVAFQKSYNHNFLSYFTCAGLAGAIAAILTTPFDVIKTKLQTQDIYQKYCSACDMTNENKQVTNKKGNNINNQFKKQQQAQAAYNFSSKVNGCEINEQVVCRKAKYESFLQTLRLILQEEGVRGLFRGYGSRIIIFSPSSAISWASYETMKKYLLKSKTAAH